LTLPSIAFPARRDELCQRGRTSFRPLRYDLDFATIADIFDYGLHEYLILTKDVSPKSAEPFSKSIVPPTKRFRRLRPRKGEPREPGIVESIRRGQRPRLQFLSPLEIENTSVIYPGVKSWCFRFPACGIVAFSGCATDEDFNAGEAAKTREAIPGEVNPNAPDASQQQVRTQPVLTFDRPAIEDRPGQTLPSFAKKPATANTSKTAPKDPGKFIILHIPILDKDRFPFSHRRR